MHDNANGTTHEIGKHRLSGEAKKARARRSRFYGLRHAGVAAGLVFFAWITTALAVAEIKDDKPTNVIAQSHPTTAPAVPPHSMDDLMTPDYERRESQTPRTSRKERQELPTVAPTPVATPSATSAPPVAAAPSTSPSPTPSPTQPKEDEEKNKGRWPWPWEDDPDPTTPPATSPPPTTSPSPLPEVTVQPTASPTDGEVVEPTITSTSNPSLAA